MLLQDTIGEHILEPSGAELLCRREDRKVLPTEVPLEDSGVQMGDHLILF